MALCADRAVVLRLTDFSETSQIVTLFTAERGQVRLIAKGLRRSTKKRISVGLDLLELGDVGYYPARAGAELGTLAEWLQRDAFAGLRRALSPLYAGLYYAELIVTLTQPDDPHEALFEALVSSLSRLAVPAVPADSTTVAATVVRFQLDLLGAVGYTPNFRNCVSCQRPRVRGSPAWFSAAAGGLICRNCEARHAEKRRIAPRLVDTKLELSPPLSWFDVFDYHLSHVAARPFNTATVLKRELARG